MRAATSLISLFYRQPKHQIPTPFQPIESINETPRTRLRNQKETESCPSKQENQEEEEKEETDNPIYQVNHHNMKNMKRNKKI
jgi:hypothetical protein